MAASHEVASSGDSRSTLRKEKQLARRNARAARAAMTIEARLAASIAIAETLDAKLLSNLPVGAVVAVFASFVDEVDTTHLVARALGRGLRVAYPRTVKSPSGVDLQFHVATPDQLVVNPRAAFQLAEPPDDASTAIAIPSLAAAVVPGLAFDRTGCRLGYGGGYYDSAFEKFPNVQRIGVAFDCQLIERVPTGAHDVSVHLLVTETSALAIHDPCSPSARVDR